MQLAVLATERVKRELQLLMILAPRLNASNSSASSGIMLRSEASVSGGEALYGNFFDCHPSQNDVVNNFYEQL